MSSKRSTLKHTVWTHLGEVWNQAKLKTKNQTKPNAQQDRQNSLSQEFTGSQEQGYLWCSFWIQCCVYGPVCFLKTWAVPLWLCIFLNDYSSQLLLPKTEKKANHTLQKALFWHAARQARNESLLMWHKGISCSLEIFVIWCVWVPSGTM